MWRHGAYGDLYAETSTFRRTKCLVRAYPHMSHRRPLNQNKTYFLAKLQLFYEYISSSCASSQRLQQYIFLHWDRVLNKWSPSRCESAGDAAQLRQQGAIDATSTEMTRSWPGCWYDVKSCCVFSRPDCDEELLAYLSHCIYVIKTKLDAETNGFSCCPRKIRSITLIFNQPASETTENVSRRISTSLRGHEVCRFIINVTSVFQCTSTRWQHLLGWHNDDAITQHIIRVVYVAFLLERSHRGSF